jgi:hypothetical protein
VIEPSLLKHDSYYCRISGGIGFPMKRHEMEERFEFVGNYFNRVKSFNQTSYNEDQLLYAKPFYQMYEECLESRKNVHGNHIL